MIPKIRTKSKKSTYKRFFLKKLSYGKKSRRGLSSSFKSEVASEAVKGINL